MLLPFGFIKLIKSLDFSLACGSQTGCKHRCMLLYTIVVGDLNTQVIRQQYQGNSGVKRNHTNTISIPKLKMVTDLVNKSIPAVSVRVLVSQEQAKHCLTPWQRLYTACRNFTVLYLLLNTSLTCPYSVCCSSPCQLLTKPSRSSTHQPVSSISSC